MSAELQVATLLRIASEDLAGARLLHQAGNRNGHYLAEQAAEKIIIAVLTSEGKHGGIGHRLDQMLDLVPDANPLKAALRDVAGLSVYATAWRYSTSGGKIPQPKGDLSVMPARVEQILADTCARFGVDVKADGPARTTAPIR